MFTRQESGQDEEQTFKQKRAFGEGLTYLAAHFLAMHKRTEDLFSVEVSVCNR